MTSLNEVKIEDYEIIKKYYMLRRPMTCDSIVLNLFLWKNCYPTKYYCTEKGLMFVACEKNGDEYYTSSPMCRDEDIIDCFYNIQDYFNGTLHQKLKMYNVDKGILEVLQLSDDMYVVEKNETYSDYIYDASSLRSLSGRKYHKKKNHYNAFIKSYEGRYSFRFLDGSSRAEINDFLSRWKDEKEGADEYEYIEYEAEGIDYILQHYDELEYKLAGVYVDGRLEAFSIGCYCMEEKTAYIPVEKANADIRGLYAFINREFLIEAFPEAVYVNREDDMGVEGLRKAKESYHPVFKIEKYNIYQR